VNYWGGTPQSTWFSGSVDFSPYESSSNGAGPTWKEAINPFAAGKEYIRFNGMVKTAQAMMFLPVCILPESEHVMKLIQLNYCWCDSMNLYEVLRDLLKTKVILFK
jgi:hypothetical protein